MPGAERALPMQSTRSRYLGHPDAVRALVQPDRVHRDLYISDEIFALEQEHFFVNTWNYVGHDSQVPKAGDFITNDVAGRPLIVVRHDDDSVRVLMNRCAHKGARVVSAPSGNTAKFFAARTTPGPTRPMARCSPCR